MCAECHSTNLRKAYDPETDSFDDDLVGDRRELRGVPRPGLPSRGVGRDPADGAARHSRTTSSPFRPERHPRGSRWSCARRATRADRARRLRPHPGRPMLDNQIPALLTEGLYHPDGQILEEVYVWGSFVQSKMYKNDVRCSDCHDVHSLELQGRGQRPLPAVPPRRCLRHLRTPLSQEGSDEGQTERRRICASSATCPSAPTWSSTGGRTTACACRGRISRSEIGTPNACTQAGCHDDRAAAVVHGRIHAPLVRASPQAALRHRSWRRHGPAPPGPRAARSAWPVTPSTPPSCGPPRWRPLLVPHIPEDENTPASSQPSPARTKRPWFDTPRCRQGMGLVADPRSSFRCWPRCFSIMFEAVAYRRPLVKLAGVPSERLFKPYQQEAYSTKTLAGVQTATMEYSLDFAFAGHEPRQSLCAGSGERATGRQTYYKRSRRDR